MAWKKEYAQRRREKYQTSQEERERRKSQGRGSEENKLYMRSYYQENKDKFVLDDDGKCAKNKRRRDRYQNDLAYRTKCIEVSKRRTNVQRKTTRLKSEFGINIDIYNKMLEAQGGECAICGSRVADKAGRMLHVDHCHKTGKVRGLLCTNCNTGLGKFKDDSILMLKAISYLKGDLATAEAEKERVTLFELATA